MNKMQRQARDFHVQMDLEWTDTPSMLNVRAKKRRITLITEELMELKSALLNNNMIESLDAIADLLYVVLGTAVELGVDIEPFFDEVHTSNLSKAGGYKREDGKWIKPSTYTPPNLKKIFYYTYGYDPDE